jgi:hypothetical protein
MLFSFGKGSRTAFIGHGKEHEGSGKRSTREHSWRSLFWLPGVDNGIN